MSETERARVILNYTAGAISKQLNTESWIEEEENVFFYKSQAAAHCFGRKSKTPVCHTTAGFVYGLVSWAVQNETWKVEEIGCMAMGEPHCTYRINKQ